MSDNLPSAMCAQQRFRLVRTFAVWSESSMGAFWIAKDAVSFVPSADKADNNCAELDAQGQSYIFWTWGTNNKFGTIIS